MQSQEFDRLVARAEHSAAIRTEAAPATLATAPVIALVDSIIEQAREKKATDIHLEPCAAGLKIRFRLDGELTQFRAPLAARLAPYIINRLKVMSRLNTAEHRQPQDGRFSFLAKETPEKPAREIDVRVSVVPVVGGEKIVLRLLNSVQRLDISELALSPPNEKLFRRWCHLAQGLILLTGPVGSGKTTLLYAGLGLMDKDEKNITTLEDPVECIIDGVNQITADETELTFARGLRAILRQDADIIVAGEIRDEDTAEIAVRSALTGRLIFSTLHTMDAAGAIIRLFDMGVKPYLLAATLAGAMGQRLVKKLCPHCREAYEVLPQTETAKILGAHYQPGLKLYRPLLKPSAAPDGGEICPICQGTGYAGRIAIHELLDVDQDLKRLIVQRPTHEEIKELAKQKSFQTMWDDGVKKAIGGETTLDEVRKAIYGYAD